MTQQPQWQPTNPPVPAVQQSWFARHKALSFVLGLTLVIVLLCCGAGVLALGGSDSDTASSSDSSTPDTTSTSTSQTSSATKSSTTKSSAKKSPTTKSSTTKSSTTKVPAPKPTTAEMTKEQENAVREAENYLEFMAFSKKGLIEQLSSDAGSGYPRPVAEFAVNHIEVDWKAQAVKSAESYLDTMPFSRQGLIDQLSSDAGSGFTAEQATYAVDQVGL